MNNKAAGILLVIGLCSIGFWSGGCGEVVKEDTTPPTIKSISPANGATGVAVNTVISAIFSKAMDTSTMVASNLIVSSTLGAVTGTASYAAASKTLTFKPASNLNFSMTYTATISANVKDASGNKLAAPYSWSFTTGTQAAAPTFSPVSGSYEANELTVTIESTTPGSNIYFTLDGSNPTTSSTLYSAPFNINSSKTIKALAVKTGMGDSSTTTVIYDLYWWQPLGGGISGGDIFALAIDNSGNLYAGGDFTSAEGVSVNYIAKWDGSSWSALGTGVTDASPPENTQVNTIISDNSGNIYVGGDFTSAGGNPANYIAKWNVSSWSNLGSGFDSDPRALALDNSGNLYAGGYMTTAGGNPAKYIAKWDKGAWSALDSGMGNIYSGAPVSALIFNTTDSSLYVGGNFGSAGGSPAERIAKWDGLSWLALGAGMDNFVNALSTDSSGSIFAGGQFTTAGGTTVNRIAKWNGSIWSTVGSGTGFDNVVKSMVFDNAGNLIVGGGFSSVDSLAVNRIARWNGSSWSTLGTGMNASPYALVCDAAGNIYAGGYFTTAGGIPVNKIAKWGRK